MEKYLELKRVIEEFLELRKNLRKRKELKESHSLSLLNYLYAVNCVIYNEGIKMREDIRKEIKDEIRKWSKWGGPEPKDQGFSSYYFYLIESEENDKKKVEEVYQINNQLDELKHKIYKISSEIFEYDIYPF